MILNCEGEEINENLKMKLHELKNESIPEKALTFMISMLLLYENIGIKLHK